MTTRLLETNPEYYTIWNYRRLLLRSFFEEAIPSTSGAEDDSPKYGIVQQYITDDLRFLLPLLRKFPKCYWIWNYRFWLLAEATRLLPPSVVYQLWQKELGLVGKMLTLDSRNFHGWGYRRQVVSALEELSVATGSASPSMTENEFAYTTKMIESNLSNFSAWHRRSKLIPRLLSERNTSHAERRDFLDKGRSSSIFVLHLSDDEPQNSSSSSVHYGLILIPRTSHYGSTTNTSSQTSSLALHMMILSSLIFQMRTNSHISRLRLMICWRCSTVPRHANGSISASSNYP